ncbi:hypothetical protein SNEBB_003451 [Seison nebaliae]|nr:hypothetical protein SNEBB_003451 [Seison nebaliae]
MTFLIILSLLLLISLTSNEWWVAVEPHRFSNVGLTRVCFNRYRHWYDYYGKIYDGCWRFWSPEVEKLTDWILRPCLTLTLLYHLKVKYRQTKIVRIIAILINLIFPILLTTIIIFAVRAKDRDWMPRHEKNFYGWSYGVCVAATFVSLFLSVYVLLFYKVIYHEDFPGDIALYRSEPDHKMTQMKMQLNPNLKTELYMRPPSSNITVDNNYSKIPYK